MYFCQSVQNLSPQYYRFAKITTAHRNGYFYRTDLQDRGRIRNRPGTRRLTRPGTSKRVVVMTEAHMTYLVIFSGRNSSRVGAKTVGSSFESSSVMPLAEETLEPRSRHWSPVYLGVRRGEGSWARSLPSRSSALIVTDNQSKGRWVTLDPARVMVSGPGNARKSSWSLALIVTDNQSKWRWGTLDPAGVMCIWAWQCSKKPLELRYLKYNICVMSPSLAMIPLTTRGVHLQSSWTQLL